MYSGTHPLRALAAATLLAFGGTALADGYIYEGVLDDGGAPADGHYDLQLLPVDQSGARLAEPVTFDAVQVVDGQFRLDVDLPLLDPETLHFELAVRDASVGDFIALAGRAKAVPLGSVGLCWSTTGDSGTDSNVNFLGTTDAQPLVLRAANAPSLRLEPSGILASSLPITTSVIAGYRLNLALPASARGATISGGGNASDPDLPGAGPNIVRDAYGTIGGGYNNQAGGGGTSDPIDRAYATVSGGRGNRASGEGSAIGGGRLNVANGSHAAIAGGDDNSAAGDRSTIAGGNLNLATETYSSVAGGRENSASAFAATVGGGTLNAASDQWATVGGGFENIASGPRATIAGGQFNVASNQDSSVLGGSANRSSGDAATVIGGVTNTASGWWSVTAGGRTNCAGGDYSFAAGRSAKVRPGSVSGLPGAGCEGVALSPSSVGDQGTFIWADASTPAAFTSTGSNQFLMRASGGVGINTNDPAGNALRVAAGTLRIDVLGTGGTNSLCRNAANHVATCSSSARYKTDIEDLTVDRALLDRLRPVSYRWTESGQTDVGFVAEEIAAIDERLIVRNAGGEVEGVKYERLTALLAAGLQQAQARADTLEVEAAALRAYQSGIEARLAEMERSQAEVLANLANELAELRRTAAR